MHIESVLPFPIEQVDIEKLLTLQIKRISRYDQQDSQKELDKLKVIISSLNKSLKDVTRYTIKYLEKIDTNTLLSYGVYQVEASGLELFEYIKGDQNSIMGLPIKQIVDYIKEYKE